ncbi:MAG: FHA domain-containing protein, partial [Caldilineaceae bacterium]|nr:FHA domain-containing protein [Caldilineaceae bacterium]
MREVRLLDKCAGDGPTRSGNVTTTADIIPGSLIYIKSKGETTFPLESPRVIVGSAAENDIVLKRPKVSRVHARFDCDD